MPDDRSQDSLFAEWDRDAGSLKPSPTLRDEIRKGGPASPKQFTTPMFARDFTIELKDSAVTPSTTVHHEHRSDSVLGDLPRSGDEVGGFRLIAELGRGAFARVFLAEEASLGGRRVALKVSAAKGHEPQILARLQHAHIVPVHSVHDDPETGLRLLCMPFLGGANLAQVLEEAWSEGEVRSHGRSLVAALDQLSRRLPTQEWDSTPARRRSSNRQPGVSRERTWSVEGGAVRLDPPEPPLAPSAVGSASGDRSCRRTLQSGNSRDSSTGFDGSPLDDPDALRPARKFLRNADIVRASVWVIARLAQGLDHAHSRGLLHRDLKPSNVLIAGDGTPMLLDFNLSVEVPTGEDDGDASISRAMLGGTLPYMAPEHLDALDVQSGASPNAVDERSDLYSLGLILFEMIAGEPPFPVSVEGDWLVTLRRMVAERSRGAPSLRARVPEVPPSLDALTSKCLDPDPNRRYQSAGELAEDLGRFLDDLPMKFGAEPSLLERSRKWIRRHPAATSSWSTGLFASLVLIFLIVGTLDLFEAMQGLRGRLKLRTFQRDYQECLFLLNTFGDDDQRLRRGLALASATLQDAGVNEAQHVYGGPWILELGETEQQEVRRAIVDLILQDAHAHVVLSSRQGTDDEHRRSMEQAVSRLNRVQAEAAFPLSIIYRQRSRYRAALGDANGAAADRAAADATPPTDGFEWTALGQFLATNGELGAAEHALRRAVSLDVTSFWAWFVLGHCHYDQGRYVDAVGDFTACVVARPDFAWAHFNRGLALARAGRPDEAYDAYSHALELDSNFTEAYVNRGMACLELGRADDAEADLREGVVRGRREPRVLAAMADAMYQQGKTDEAERMFDDLLAQSPHDPALKTARGITRLRTRPTDAASDFKDVLAQHPRHALAHYGMARVLREEHPEQAVLHLDQALLADPGFFNALELRALVRARRGDRRAVDDVEELVRNPTALRLYNSACALALLGEAVGEATYQARAVDLLSRALRAGIPGAQAAADPDLKSVRHRVDYTALLRRSTPSQ